MNQPAKVALELQPCIGQRSGIGNYTYELAKRLTDDEDLRFSGNMFNFIGRNENAASLAGITMPVKECQKFPYGVYRRLWHWLSLSYDKLFPDVADLSVFFNYIVPPRISGKVLNTVHDLTWLRFPETMDKKNLRRIERDIDYSIGRSDRILTISEFSKREIIDLLGVSEEKIRLLPCAATDMPEAADWAEVKRKHNLTRPYLLYVGNIEPRKNLSRLLQAFDLLKSEQGIAEQLVIAGGSGWGSAEFQQTLQRMKHTEDVVQVGYVEPAVKRALYANAAAFVFPSLYEGFGIPPLEAMSCGCPVVCTNAASLPEVVGEAAELVDPLDVQSIAGGIWRVVSDREYADKLRLAGFGQVEKYSWEQSAARFKKICQEVLGLE